MMGVGPPAVVDIRARKTMNKEGRALPLPSSTWGTGYTAARPEET